MCRVLKRVAVVCVAATLIAGCAHDTSAPAGATTPASPSTAPSAADGSGVASPAEKVLASMSLEQQIGQLFMVGTPATGLNADTKRAVEKYHVGNLMLTGRGTAGTKKTAAFVKQLQAMATSARTKGVKMLVSTDQEGGRVQVLSGPGFDTMPSAVQQGKTATATLQANATRWGKQLAAAGVSMDLGPVLDTVPASNVKLNEPIGRNSRQFGTTPALVAEKGTAVAKGLAAGGVVPVIKHFPGLGRVAKNTDSTKRVKDTVTTRHDLYLTPFKTAIDAGAPVVMMSSAFYTQIDHVHEAAFSPTIIGGVLRGDLGFDGVVMSDSFNSAATSLVPATDRAVRFVDAGGDLVLVTTAVYVPQMYAGMLARAKKDSAFRAKVRTAVLRVLKLKQKQGLLG